MKRGETVAIWKGARTRSVWEYTIPPLLPEFKLPVWRLFCFFYLYYDLDPVVKPRDDTTVLKLCDAGKGEINTARVGGGVIVCFAYPC